jgi:hypothetical protein
MTPFSDSSEDNESLLNHAAVRSEFGTKAPPRLKRWRIITFAVLFSAYVGFYFCRTNLTVATPLLIDDEGLDLDKSKVGYMISLGTTILRSLLIPVDPSPSPQCHILCESMGSAYVSNRECLIWE